MVGSGYGRGSKLSFHLFVLQPESLSDQDEGGRRVDERNVS